MAKNWAGHETLRRRMLRSKRKWGNNSAEANALGKRVIRAFNAELKGQENLRGGKFSSSGHCARQFIVQGRKTGATPDGRLAGDEMSKNLSPTPGADTEGVTALINTITTLDYAEDVPGDMPVDVALHPSTVVGDAGLKLMRQIVVRNGGRIEKDASGKEWIVLPDKAPVPSPYVPSWQAGPIANSRFTETEMAQQTQALHLPDAKTLQDPDSTVRVQKALDALWPGWKTSPNGPDLNPGYRESVGTPEEALYGCVLTHPPKKGVPVTLSRTLKIPEGDPKLHFTVGNSPKGDFRLEVRVNGTAILATVLDKTLRGTSLCPFQTFDLSLEPWAGRTVTVELVQQPTGWEYESAVWHDIRITSSNGV